MLFQTDLSSSLPACLPSGIQAGEIPQQLQLARDQSSRGAPARVMHRGRLWGGVGEPGSAEAEEGAGRKCRLANCAGRCCEEASGRAQAGLSRLAQSSGRGDARFAPKAVGPGRKAIVGLDSARELLQSPGAGEPNPESSAWSAAPQAAVLGRSVTEIPGLATEGFGAQGR